jgi:peroxiredoxin
VKGGPTSAPTSPPAARFQTTSYPTTRTSRKLSELQGDDPLILTLARGHYCPKEHQQHLELAVFYPKVAVAYTQIATIATDEHHELQEFRASVGAQWSFFSDPGRTVQKDLDIQEYTDPEHDPMIPHTLVLKPGLVVHSIYNGYWFWGRPSVDDLRHDLRAVTREIRPDWDLSAPPDCAMPGTLAISRPSMVGTSAPLQAGALPDARGPASYIRGPSGGSVSS